jgi:hypothetical protein
MPIDLPSSKAPTMKLVDGSVPSGAAALCSATDMLKASGSFSLRNKLPRTPFFDRYRKRRNFRMAAQLLRIIRGSRN